MPRTLPNDKVIITVAQTGALASFSLTDLEERLKDEYFADQGFTPF